MIQCNGYTRYKKRCKRILKHKYYCKQHFKSSDKYETNKLDGTYIEIYNKKTILLIFKWFILVYIVNIILKKILEIMFLYFLLYLIIYNFDYFFIMEKNNFINIIDKIILKNLKITESKKNITNNENIKIQFGTQIIS
jgi:hypothetical protein